MQHLESQNYQLGKLYQEGYYTGSMNGYDYFVISNSMVTFFEWNSGNVYCHDNNYIFPSKDELIMMYKNKFLFNSNCPKNEQWYNNIYWTSSETGNNSSWFINFGNGDIYSHFKNQLYYVRPVKKILTTKER